MGDIMATFLGYDPGGAGKNGVAAIELGSITPTILDTAIVSDASEAIGWLSTYSLNARALGIDTLLAWSLCGRRACDDALRRKYGGHSVISQNSLYSAMTVNGAIVAKRMGLPAYESHPKLLLKTQYANVIRPAYDKSVSETNADHEGDAIIAAYCAAMGYTQRWSIDLFSEFEDDLEMVVPNARYPWFENVQNQKS